MKTANFEFDCGELADNGIGLSFVVGGVDSMQHLSLHVINDYGAVTVDYATLDGVELTRSQCSEACELLLDVLVAKFR